MFQINNRTLTITIPKPFIERIGKFFEKHALVLLTLFLTILSIGSYIYFYNDGLGLSYNDARSHLDIGRRVVESLKPGFAQLGSVWLPLPHLLMVPTIWNDFMWHSGLSGALQSMIGYVVVGFLIYKSLEKLGVGMFGRVVGVLVFALNLNVLYLQSTAMTELLLLCTLTLGVYELINWHKKPHLYTLLKAAFWIMLSTLDRYDGWFLFVYACCLIVLYAFRKKGLKEAEGMLILFGTLAGFGIALWFLWNLAIFKDPLYFAFGPFSAHAQQDVLLKAGNLATKGNILLSTKMYFYALVYNAGLLTVILSVIGAIMLFRDKRISTDVKIGSTAFLSPLIFNILALYLGFSVLFIQGISGNTWFNVRYGIMMIPSFAVYVGYLAGKSKNAKYVILGCLILVTFFSFNSFDAVTIDDARVGASQKNVSQVSNYLHDVASQNNDFILISAASHDAIIFSSGLPMSRFIHEGTGRYWEEAIARPDHWARYIILRTGDMSDLTYRSIYKDPGFKHYTLVHSFPFADIYVLKDQYLSQLENQKIFADQK